jgi:hypothetical protein
MLYFHDGLSDFPHGAGPSDSGWYCYPFGDTSVPPNGPYASEADARAELIDLEFAHTPK